MNFTQFQRHAKFGASTKGNKIMADPAHKLPENVPGFYYVDDTCTDCDICRTTAPQFFTRQDALGYSYVHRQPETPEEIAQAEEARLGCPTETIGNDGGPPDQA
jgi:ferredoxin